MPIYDTSYQHYHGPKSLTKQWYVVAQVTTQWMLRKKAVRRAAFAVVTSIVGFALLLFFTDKMQSALGQSRGLRYDEPILKFFEQKVTVGYLLSRYLGILNWPIFIAVLSAGVGAVAYERQSGGLVAILARPIRRRDYLFGKALGVVGLSVGIVAIALTISYLLTWGYFLTWRGALKGLVQLGWILAYVGLLGVLLGLSTLAAVAMTHAVRAATSYLVLYWLGPVIFGAAIFQAHLERWAVWIFPLLQLETMLASALDLTSGPDKGPLVELVERIPPAMAEVALFVHVIALGLLSLRIFKGVR